MVIDKAEKTWKKRFVFQKNELFGSSDSKNPFKIIRLQQALKTLSISWKEKPSQKLNYTCKPQLSLYLKLS